MSRLTWIAIALLIFISVVTRQRLLFLLSLILLLLAAASALWAHFCLAAISYTRKFAQRRLFYGDDAQLELEIVNAKPLPLPWLRIDDEFPNAMHPEDDTPIDAKQSTIGARRRLVNVLSMRWYERVVRRYPLKGARRGIWHFGPAQIRSGDIFGFDIRRETQARLDSLLVYPKVVPLHALTLPSGHPFGEFRSQRRMIEDPLRLMGTRAYAPGDSYRHIHWKASARRQTLQTKVFEPSATRPVAIFLNLSTVTGPQTGFDPAIMEFAICTAASIGRHVWEEGQPVGLYANALVMGQRIDAESGQRPMVGRVRIAPRSHPEQLLRILEALARVDNRSRWSISNVLQAERGALAFGTTIAIVSAVNDPQLIGTLSDLKRKGFPVVLFSLGQGKLENPILGVTEYYIGSHEEWAKLEEIQSIR